MEGREIIIDKEEQDEPRDLGLYIHIPFCVKKCGYCDFLSAPATDRTKKDYFDALLTEIESYGGRTREYIVPTIFFGGGTPSCVEAGYIREIMETVSRVFLMDKSRLEATIEVNPGTVTEEKLHIYKEAGINRLSFGLQSVNNKELVLLGRIHTYEQFKENYRLAREAGFSNINIDLMSALPGQTLPSWENTLYTVIDLQPEHISAYGLIIEEGTEFYERYREGAPGYRNLPDEDTDRRIYHRTKEILESNNYFRYEISNYAKRGFECRHNSSYWIGTEYLGIGLGASSLLNSARFSNLQSIKQYIQLCKEFKHNQNCMDMVKAEDNSQTDIMSDLLGIRQDFENLTPHQRMEEFMFLGLRRCTGVSKNAFFQRFGQKIDTIYGGVLEQLSNYGLIEFEDDFIKLTEYGIDISNSVLSVFLLN